MATHSSILACKIPWMVEPGGLRTLHRITKSQIRLSDLHTEGYFSKTPNQNSWSANRTDTRKAHQHSLNICSHDPKNAGSWGGEGGQ